MKKIIGIITGVLCWGNTVVLHAAEKFEILPDLPEPLAAAQASSVSTTNNTAVSLAANTAGQEPNILSVIFSLIFVVLLIYATGIIYTKLNKLGLNTLKKQMGEASASKVNVVSTTPLGGNKTLHVVELDGKRMLIGASQNSIHLIKDLGVYPPVEFNENKYSKIEIPEIKIPKIEIPKIEFPNIGFTKAFSDKKNDNEPSAINEQVSANNDSLNDESSQNENFEISDIYEEGPDGIIDKLFTTNTESEKEEDNPENSDNTHKVDPDEYALYKKYL